MEIKLKVAHLPKHALCLIFTIILMNAICPEKAHAYLDPGTGSMILQVIIAAIAGVGCTFKIWGQKFSNFVKRLFKREENDGK